MFEHRHSWKEPLPAKRALVVRYGGIGDMIMASSILPQLKEKGYHVTVMTTPDGQEVVRHDPHIDAFMLQDRDQVPNGALPEYWYVWAKKFDAFINLSESVEGNLLPNPGSSRHAWPNAMRQKYLNENYLEFQHELAGLEYKPRPRFYATPEELARVETFRAKLGPEAYVVLWALAGSSVHKVYPHSDQVVAQLLIKNPDVRVIFVGDDACRILESHWEAEPRVIRLSGRIGVRETLALACHGVDCVVGPETGVLNAVSHLGLPKVVMLSHSSVKNLTRNWANTVSLTAGPLEAPCFPCHRIHHERTFCPSKKLPVETIQELLAVMDDNEREIMGQHIADGMFDTGAALCAYGIAPERVTNAILASQPAKKRIVVPA
jgi:ADP-heptose:LPS heptosyltransferase